MNKKKPAVLVRVRYLDGNIKEFFIEVAQPSLQLHRAL